MRKLLILGSALIFCITACDGWSYSVPTFPAPPPTITPAIYSPTPLILTPTNTADLPTITPTETISITPTTNFTDTPIATPSLPPFAPNITVEIIGCDTSIDITHGMGEVTNAFVTLKNDTGANMKDLCATLFALDEGRVHPDKTVCVPALDHGQQVTLKLTVDSTYKKDTLIQAEVKSGENLLARVDSPSCTDVGLFAPNPDLLRTPVSIQ